MNLFQILSNFLAIKDTRKRSSQARPTAAAFLPRTNEDTSKLEPPNVIAFKRQQAHLAHKEASLTWKKGGTMGASHKTWIFNGPFDLIKLCLLSSSLAEMAWIFIFLLKTIELHRRLNFSAAVEMARTVSSNKKRRLPIWSDLKNHFAPFWTVATALQFFCCEIDSAITILQYTLWPRWHSWKSSRRGKTFYGTFHGSYYYIGKSQRQRRSQDFLLRSVGMESSLLLSILPSLQS